MINLYENINYTNKEIPFLISNYIREYDIRKANINILYNANVISDNEYNYLLNAPRDERQVKIGLLEQHNPFIVKILQDGIIKAKEQFFKANNITNNDVLCIKNDAVFLINKVAYNNKFGNIEFVNKNVYTSFYRLNNLELYYYNDMMLGTEKIDIKGMKDQQLMLHQKYFLEFLLVTFESAQTQSIKDTLDIVITFYNRYLNLEVEKEYYREFNPESLYSMKKISNIFSYKSPYITQEQLKQVDISHNLNMIRQLFQYYSSIQFK